MNPERRKFFAKIGVGLGIPLLPTDVCFEDPTGNKLQVKRNNRLIWFVDVGNVVISDLIAHPSKGKIVRCYKDPRECVMIYELP